ncbi:hypothetical protein M3Y94_00035800 [Aphelenchoides besseyi]|nr:hypothetical protein M3Y94_00035800 [Aphelenchoides besseyi]KAI6219049.1 hypothetical protein M3Y95_01125500 [Aphelenchoides besseyi]
MAATTTLKSASHSWQTNLQGLRAVAIFAVLVFHASSNHFAQGYLGVDIFFVISGFLMCKLLTAKAPLSMADIRGFYFRRIKRIIPTYLFVIFCFLLLAIFFISPTDYCDLRNELTKPLLFASNVPNNDHQNYFVEVSEGYRFVVHLWSLSVELQFYLIVPFLVLFLHRLTILLQLLVVISIAMISLYTQIHSSKDAEHMATYNRLWQFMSGFIAFYLQQNIEHQPENYVELVNEGKEKIKMSKVQASKIAVSCVRGALKLIGMMLPLFLLFVLYSPLSDRKAVNRLTVVGITTLIIGISETSVLLSNSLFVAIGDISYSVYLVHFMLFKYYDYEFIILIYKQVNIPVVVGIVLIVASILIGWIVERTFKNLNPHITRWSTLLLLISGLYLAIGLTLFYLKANEINLDIEKEFEMENPEQVMNKAIELYEHSKSSPLNLTVDEQIYYNRMFYPAALNLWYCEEKEQLPSSYVGGGMLRNNSCTIKGNGTKHIVVLGNSHTPTLIAGIKYHFHDYSTITPIYRYACQFVGGSRRYRQYSLCAEERKAILPILRSFNHPIDIIIVGIAYTSTDPDLRGNLTTDSVFREMQKFFNELNNIAREIVIIPQIHVLFSTPYRKVLQRRLQNQQSLEIFRLPYEVVVQQKPNNRKRLDAVRCSKCVLFNHMDVLCSRKNGYCDPIDHKQRISLMYDQRHPSLYGSFFYGEHLRRIYDQKMTTKQTLMLTSN